MCDNAAREKREDDAILSSLALPERFRIRRSFFGAMAWEGGGVLEKWRHLFSHVLSRLADLPRSGLLLLFLRLRRNRCCCYTSPPFLLTHPPGSFRSISPSLRRPFLCLRPTTIPLLSTRSPNGAMALTYEGYAAPLKRENFSGFGAHNAGCCIVRQTMCATEHRRRVRSKP